ncbi:MAG: YHYH protein [Planctomycetota bacterium]
MKFYYHLIVYTSFLVIPATGSAHEWHRHSGGDHRSVDDQANQDSSQQAKQDERTAPIEFLTLFREPQRGTEKPELANHFDQFKNVKTRWSGQTLFIESNGLPDHQMMVGIRSWQQQVPIPQPFSGNNAWQITLNPKLSNNPRSARDQLFRGAIAIAVNGVPIFNALNNRGEDAFLAGELDKWGGHCGRGDDYHYHIAPVHLEEIVGKGNPIAVALDGFPIYGLTEADGSPVGKLDEYNGQFDDEGRYHYHATEKYPYINGGLRGVVSIRGDQIDQPRDSPIRPAMRPLRGARITDFKSSENQSVLTYTIGSQTGTVSYSAVSQNSWKFVYAEPGGRTWSETYERRERAGGRERGGDRDRRGGPDRRRPPPPRR